MRLFPIGYLALVVSGLLFLLSLFLTSQSGNAWWLVALFGLLTIVGIRDVLPVSYTHLTLPTTPYV